MKVQEALGEFERLYTEVRDITDDSSKISDDVLMFIFLDGLGDHYRNARENIHSSGLTARSKILMRLKNAEREEVQQRSSARKANMVRCWNCDKQGHNISECPKNDKNERIKRKSKPLKKASSSTRSRKSQ